MNNYFYIANWKLNMNVSSSLDFLKNNYEDLRKITNSKKSKLIICPSFITLYPISKIIESTEIKIGAQNCSAYLKGNYTGEVSAQYLKETNCLFCIVGHSETRKYNNETDEIILEKFKNLISLNISPILCIGESLEENKSNKTFGILEKQLSQVLKEIEKRNSSQMPEILIAYEPIWSIGSGVIAQNDHIEKVLSWIKTRISDSNNAAYKLIYGGSVNAENIKNLKKIKLLDGFLIGGASLNFQDLKKIVDCE